MDSITQMALGAACGEVVLGNKIGNRAMLWGAIAGTIPDLDVLGNLFLSEINALAFHRSITHSILFAVVFPFLLSYIARYIYKAKHHQNIKFKTTISILGLSFLALIVAAINFIVYTASDNTLSLPILIISISILGLFGFLLNKNYIGSTSPDVVASPKQWYTLFFIAIITHPLLDSCTAYGTQLFQPFWDYRVAFNNISVVDPLYTLWFIILLTMASLITRKSILRYILTILSIIGSTCYIAYTFYHKHKVNQIFTQSLQKQNIDYQRYMTAPTILNNILWNCVAEGPNAYYQGHYSFFDQSPSIPNIKTIPKDHQLLDTYKDHREVEIIKWFSNNYFTVQRNKDTLQINDLRYGTRALDTDKYIFYFNLIPQPNGSLKVTQPIDRNVPKNEFQSFIKRIKGIKQ